ncbi:unnamed protein product [Eruca vesicaria subsp. sativa]|uniref:Uncharacterized protein n=1 Tax=Eruca vesicaria subsp. sativa TaxID=29727 RepID=A0ABC8KNU6_ERUVS|nr:unnamed protein product [Eruca vesicaria subsp. sativa]
MTLVAYLISLYKANTIVDTQLERISSKMVDGFNDDKRVRVAAVSSLGKVAVHVEDVLNQSKTNSSDVVVNQIKTNDSDVVVKSVGFKDQGLGCDFSHKESS